MKRHIFSILFVCLTSVLTAQVNTRFSQLNFAPGINNPAALALDGTIMADLIYRNQWSGLDGAPVTFGFNGQYELMSDMAVGLNVYHDRIGVFQTTSIQGQYAYRLLFSGSRALIFGAGVGMDNKVVDYASTTTTISQDPVFANTYSRVVFNSSVGTYYRAPKFYVGLSIPQMFDAGFNSIGKARLKYQFHYFMNMGFYLGNGNYTFNPHIQVKAIQNAPLAADLILRNTFAGRWSLVLGYRSENALIAGFDVLITPNVRAGYSFNYNVGTLSRTKGMANEVYLGLGFPYGNSREDFGKRRYTSRKMAPKSDFKRRSNRNTKKRLIHR